MELSNDIYEHSNKLLLFSRLRKNYFNIDAVFSDETENYRTPVEPEIGEEVTVKIKVGKDNPDNVYIVLNGLSEMMEKAYSNDCFDYYSFTIPPSKDEIKYYFIIQKCGRNYCYSKQGVTRDIDMNYCFTIYRGFHVPDWAKGAVMYQIFVDRFCNGDEKNDVVNNEYAYLGKAAKKVEKWNQPIANEDICNFYGGDLQGIINKIPYLKELGVDVIYLNPIFVSPSSHKYDIQDYDYVDPHFGVIVNDGGEPLYFEKFRNKYATKYMKRTTDKENLDASNQLFAKLVEEAHKNGIKVILDGVFNHCGAFNKWLDKEGFYSSTGYPDGAYKSENSAYHNYFRWYEKDWPNNDCYDGWWGHDNHPKLNYEGSKELYNYIIEVGKKWVSPPFNADGWRLDVAADLGITPEFNHKFWKDFRNAVKEANPSALILAEHYGDASSWLQGDQWDTIMNYDAFMEPLSWFLTGMEKHSESANAELYCNADNFENAMRFQGARLPAQSLFTAMNELSNHDHSRFLTRTNRKIGRLHTVGKEEADTGINKAIMREAVTIQMTWPGSPTIYYGDEAGLTGWTDPDNRRTYPWGDEDKALIALHKELIKIHKDYSAICTGSLEYLCRDYGILVYSRFNESESIVTAVNNNNIEKKINIPVWRTKPVGSSKFKAIFETDENGFNKEEKNFMVIQGEIEITLKPFSSMILISD